MVTIDRNLVLSRTLLLALIYAFACREIFATRFADQLYEDLMYFYNKNVRPVKNASDAVTVIFGASLIRIIDVDEVNQVLTTNLWLEMQWYDNKLKWEPASYGGLKKLHIPSEMIWVPDILLYNKFVGVDGIITDLFADGEPHITIQSDALVYYTGAVVWKPPSIYKSFCPIDIEYFPYDRQSCFMKFGGWSYNGFLLDIKQLPSRPGDVVETKYDERGNEYQYLEQGMDLSFFYSSLEWDLISLTSKRHSQLYAGCCGQEFYIDISFDITIRRKTLFYTVNLVIPCMLIAFLTTFVFYIPACEHKMTFAISILVTLTVFYLVLIELIPPSSLVIPLIGKYLLFTMFLVSGSIVISVVTLNFYRRKGTSHPMPSWMKFVFLRLLPRPLCLKPHDVIDMNDDSSSASDISPEISRFVGMVTSRRSSPYFLSVAQYLDSQVRLTQLAELRGMHPDLIRRMADNVAFIADHFRARDKENLISDDWSYVAMVIDRLLLIVFSVINITGTVMIILQSPVLYDNRLPLAIPPAAKPLGGDTFSFDALINGTR